MPAMWDKRVFRNLALVAIAATLIGLTVKVYVPNEWTAGGGCLDHDADRPHCLTVTFRTDGSSGPFCYDSRAECERERARYERGGDMATLARASACEAR